MIPNDVKRAQMLLAYQLVVSPDAITGQPLVEAVGPGWDVCLGAAVG